MRLAAVVPARDEELLLPACLESLAPFRAAGDAVVVVDNGSRDATASIARERGFTVVVEPRLGRGHAISAGYLAVRDSVDWVLVVHADMVVAAGTREAMETAIAGRPDCVGGALGHRIADRRPAFRAIEAGNGLRARWLGLPYGDQAQFFQVAAIERFGGFPDIRRCEDLALSLRLRRSGRLVFVDHPVTIPARHWAGGILRATLRNWRTALKFALSYSEVDRA
jgi:glycosyltransferase involved in cell wall biosynthesis